MTRLDLDAIRAFASRCRDHGIDPLPISLSTIEALLAEIETLRVALHSLKDTAWTFMNGGPKCDLEVAIREAKSALAAGRK